MIVFGKLFEEKFNPLRSPHVHNGIMERMTGLNTIAPPSDLKSEQVEKIETLLVPVKTTKTTEEVLSSLEENLVNTEEK